MSNLRSRMLVALSASGCGLIDVDATELDLTLPGRMYSIDTDNWQVDPADQN